MRRKKILKIALPAVAALSLVTIGICMILFVARAQGMTRADNVKVSKDFEEEYFITVTKGRDYRIVYAHDTKVKYFIYTAGRRYGITPLYNADGTLQVYEEKKADDIE